MCEIILSRRKDSMKEDEIVNFLWSLWRIVGVIMLGIYVFVFVQGLKNNDRRNMICTIITAYF